MQQRFVNLLQKNAVSAMYMEFVVILSSFCQVKFVGIDVALLTHSIMMI